MEFEKNDQRSEKVSTNEAERLATEFEEAFFKMPGFTQEIYKRWLEGNLGGKQDESISFKKGPDVYDFARSLTPDNKRRALFIKVTDNGGLSKTLCLNPSAICNMIIYNEGKGGKELTDERAWGKADELLNHLKQPANK